MRKSPLYLVMLTVAAAFAGCENTPQTTAPSPNVSFALAQQCELQGGGVDGNGEVVASLRKHGSAIRIEGVFTLCSQPDDGIWFKISSFVDDGSDSGHPILLASDHDPVVLRQGTDSSGVTTTSWQVNIDFVSTAAPLVEPNGFQPRVVVEAYGHGGRIGEVLCYLDESLEPGPRGPRPHN